MTTSRMVVLSVALAVSGCEDPPPPIDPAVHSADVEAWREWRHADLMQPDGWLSLVGLYWLEPGRNTFGADPGNKIVFPPENALANIGQFVLDNDTVSMTVRSNLGVQVDGKPVQRYMMSAPSLSESPVATMGSLQWHVIKRQERFAIRLKDSLSSTRTEFPGVEMFDLNPEWRFVATFDRYDPPKTIKVPNILGTVSDQPSPGAVVFKVGRKKYRLDVTQERDNPNYFIVFADQTNGFETYGGGRFVWVDVEDENGRVVLDFNKSYNPPCVFTYYATCPLPPRQNRLPLRIEAGEKDYKAPQMTLKL